MERGAKRTIPGVEWSGAPDESTNGVRVISSVCLIGVNVTQENDFTMAPLFSL